VQIITLFEFVSVFRLKSSTPYYSNTLDSLIGTWEHLYATNECFILEAVEHVSLSPQGSTAAIKNLQQISSKLQSQVGNHVNTLLFVGSKLLSWTSTRGSLHLGAMDILFLIMLCRKSETSKFKKNKSKRPQFSALSLSSNEWTTPPENSDSDSGGFLSSKEDLSDSSDTETVEEADDAMENEGKCMYKFLGYE